MLKHTTYLTIFLTVFVAGCSLFSAPAIAPENLHKIEPLSGILSYPIEIERTPLVVVGDIPSSAEPVVQEKPKDYIEMTVTATAYCPCRRCCGPHAQGLTKTEANAWGPGVAVDPRVIPLGSVLVVPSFNNEKPIFADDVGGKIRGRKIDVRMKYHWQAKEWGTQVLVVRVYKPR